MKKLLLVMLLMFSIGITAQTDSTAVDGITEAERVIDKYSSQASEAIVAIAESLKVPAEHVYSVLITQAIAEGIAFWVILILIGIAVYILYKKGNILHKDYIAGKADDIYLAFYVPAALISILILVAVVAAGYGNITKLINPEYHAIKDIMDFIKA